MSKTRIHPTQIQGTDESRFSDLDEQIKEMDDRFSKDRLKRTIVYYFSAMRKTDHVISLFVPFEGEAFKVYVKASDPSFPYLDFIVRKESGEIITEGTLSAGESVREIGISEEINNEIVQVAISSSETGAEDISIYIEMMPK